jgi:hypothetical protein
VTHPCTIRCWRVGAPSGLDENGVCLECGRPTPRPEDDPRRFLRLVPDPPPPTKEERITITVDGEEFDTILAALYHWSKLKQSDREKCIIATRQNDHPAQDEADIFILMDRINDKEA